MSNSLYFPHDSCARNDEKMLMLRAEQGMEGVGVYWCLVESLFEDSESKLRTDKIKGIAVSLNVTPKRLEEILETCFNEGLFKRDKEWFWSDSLIRRKEVIQEKSESASRGGKQSAKARKEKKERLERLEKELEDQTLNATSTGVEQTLNTTSSERSTNKEKKINKIKEKKEDKTKKDPRPIIDQLMDDEKWKKEKNLDESVVVAFREYEQGRKETNKFKPLTPTSAKGIITKMVSLSSNPREQVQMLVNATGGNWGNVFELKDDEKQALKTAPTRKAFDFSKDREWTEPKTDKHGATIGDWGEEGDDEL